LEDRRRVRFYATSPSERAIDLCLELRATHGPAVLGATKEAGFLGIRMHPDIAAASQLGGQIVNACAGRGEAECWSRQAPWTDYSGIVAGNRVGIAALDHPRNPRYPTRWHVRDYGLFAANPWYWDGPISLASGQTLTFQYRIWIHAGDAEGARIATRCEEYAFPRAIQRGPS
jgi:hypothetical protein